MACGPGVMMDKDFPKDFLVIVPLLGSAIAITYDVGFFAGIGLPFFTFFTLTEHINFSLQALPIAVMIAVAIVIYLTSDFILEQRQRKVETLDTKKKWLRAGWAILIVGALLIFFYVFGVVSVAFFASGFLTAALIRWIRTSDPSKPILAAWTGIITLVIAFLVGFGVARSDLINRGTPVTLKTTEGVFKANLIRSGDRGVLLYLLDSNTVSLVRWDSVKEISGVR